MADETCGQVSTCSANPVKGSHAINRHSTNLTTRFTE